MRSFLIFLLFLSFLAGIPSASAAEVTLSTPQGEYYVLVGEEAIIPLTLVSTYDHDITGTLNQAMMPVNAGNNGSGTRGASLQSRSLTAFTEQRTVSLSVGKSDTPADYHLTLTFSYPDGGGRVSTLNGIRVHFVTGKEEAPANHETRTSTDSLNLLAGKSSASSAPAKESPPQNPSLQLQNTQMQQDMSALKNDLARERNQSKNHTDELLEYILADPLIIPLDRQLESAGFTQGTPEITPSSNRSGNFLLTYSSGVKTVDIRGIILETQVQFAEETSTVPLPLPESLLDNITYQEYGNRIAETGFLRQKTRINVTSGRKTIDLMYSDAKNRNLALNAEIVNGSVTAVDGQNPEDPLALAVPVAGFVVIILISIGIVYFARFRPADIPGTANQDHGSVSPGTAREIALALLDDAELDAARGSWPEAYRKTGRALRVFLSQEVGKGDELTNRESEHLIGSCTGDPDQIRFILDRCRTVGFAKDLPEPGEFREMIQSARTFIQTPSPP